MSKYRHYSNFPDERNFHLYIVFRSYPVAVAQLVRRYVRVLDARVRFLLAAEATFSAVCKVTGTNISGMNMKKCSSQLSTLVRSLEVNNE